MFVWNVGGASPESRVDCVVVDAAAACRCCGGNDGRMSAQINMKVYRMYPRDLSVESSSNFTDSSDHHRCSLCVPTDYFTLPSPEIAVFDLRFAAVGQQAIAARWSLPNSTPFLTESSSHLNSTQWNQKRLREKERPKNNTSDTDDFIIDLQLHVYIIIMHISNGHITADYLTLR